MTFTKIVKSCESKFHDFDGQLNETTSCQLHQISVQNFANNHFVE